MPGTPIAERDARLARVRERMQASGLDVLVLGCKGHWWTGRGHMRYLADFHLWGHDGLILVPLDGEPAVVVNSPAVAHLIARRGWIEECYGDMLVLPKTLDLLRARGLSQASIGTVGTHWIIPAEIARGLYEAFPRARFEDADALLDGVRMAKSPLEIAQNRELWALAQSSVERFHDVLTPGIEARALCAEPARVALAGGARDVLMLVGDRAELYGPPDESPLRCDELVRFHMEICGESGHWCELTTTLAYRELTDAERSLMASELRARDAVQAAARPGARLAELAATFESVLLEDGWALGEPTGHFDFHGQGQDVIEKPWFAAEQPWGGSADSELPAGAVISYHPRRNVVADVSWYPGVSDNLVITEEGSEWLSHQWPHEWRESRK